MKRLLCLILIPFISLTTPEISVIVTIFNKEFQIQQVLNGIIENTTTPFELVLVFDGCTDTSESKAMEILNNNRGTIENLVIVQAPNVNETRANNMGMKASSGKYLILIQDDMCINQLGWEQVLIKPMKQYDDVFAVSALWAGNYAPFSADSTKKHSYNNIATNKKSPTFAVRDAVCRGPLALDAAVMKQLDYLDEAYAPLHLDDHDLCIRAYKKLKKVCGFYPITCKQLTPTCPRLDKIDKEYPMSTGEYYSDILKRNRKLFWNRYHKYFSQNRKMHTQNRPITI